MLFFNQDDQTPAVLSTAIQRIFPRPSLAILAACLNCPVSAATYEETGATGAAMMAAVSIGLYRDMAECAARWIAGIEGETEHPDPNLTAVYDLLFPVYREGYEALPTVWQQLHAARRKIDGG